MEHQYLEQGLRHRAEAGRIFAGLSEAANVEAALQEMFWGGYDGALTDRFGMPWMVETRAKE